MAIVRDVYVFSQEILDIYRIKNCLDKNQITFQGIKVIDSWTWDNEMNIDDLDDMIGLVRAGKIAIIHLKSKMFKSAGLYIEREGCGYLYNLWVNAEEDMCSIDRNSFDRKTAFFLENVSRVILDITKWNSIKAVGIGAEADICYDEDVRKMVQGSRDMMVWILGDDMIWDSALDGYAAIEIEGRKIFVKRA